MKNKFQIPSVNGGFIKCDEARSNCRKPILLGEIKGHLFDLDKIEEFVANIRAHNLQTGLPAQEKVKYVRIYYSRSTRRGYNNKKDLVLVPVMASGDDLYAVSDKIFSSDNILSESTPCPNLCGTKKGLNCPE